VSRLAAVTGGTGFIGSHVTAAFAAAGWRLRLLVRREAAARPADAETVRGGLDDPAALAALVDGAEAVIHIAGAIKARSRTAFMSANRDGTAALAQAWRAAAPDARFVLVSSMAARAPGLSAYAASKAAGEAALARAAPGAAVVLRPPAVYGPGDRETLVLFRTAGWAVQPVPMARDARLALIHAGDLAAAVLAAAGRQMAPGVYEVSDARPAGYAWHEIVAAACAACGRPARPLPVPGGVLRLAALWGDLVALGGATPMLTSGKRREILHADWSSRPEAQPPGSLWRPRRDLPTGFAETVAWYRGAGWLPRARRG
jgi:nucleoside-diphosphate-sugar epimerase